MWARHWDAPAFPSPHRPGVLPEPQADPAGGGRTGSRKRAGRLRGAWQRLGSEPALCRGGSPAGEGCRFWGTRKGCGGSQGCQHPHQTQGWGVPTVTKWKLRLPWSGSWLGLFFWGLRCHAPTPAAGVSMGLRRGSMSQMGLAGAAHVLGRVWAAAGRPLAPCGCEVTDEWREISNASGQGSRAVTLQPPMGSALPAWHSGGQVGP